MTNELADLLLRAAGALRDGENWADDPQGDSLLADELEQAAAGLTTPSQGACILTAENIHTAEDCTLHEHEETPANVTVRVTVEAGMPEIEGVDAPAGMTVRVSIRDYDCDGADEDADDIKRDAKGRMYVERGDFYPGATA